MHKKNSFRNFVEVIADHAHHLSDKTAFTYLGNSGEVTGQCSFAQLHQNAKAVAGWLRQHAGAGDRAVLIYGPGMPFIHAFMGCLYAGVTAVPVAPPATADMLQRLRHILDDASPAVVLADTMITSLFQAMKGQLDQFKNVALFNTQNIDERWASDYHAPPIDRQTLAFLQYTSGSTGHPKGVMVTHGNLLHNETILAQFTGQTKQSVAVAWLPHFHDMGLIGCILFPSFVGFTSILMPPERFVRDPLSWLQAISDYRGTFSTAPNFAYTLCVRHAAKARNAGFDLSDWQVAINGAEPVRMEVLERFYQSFKVYGLKRKALCPAYGLAEATLFVCGGGTDKGPSGIWADRQALERNQVIKSKRTRPGALTIVDHGATSDDQRLVVVDPSQGTVCPQRSIGEIWLAGPSVAAGYWNHSSKTQETFQARLADGDGPFLRTGDLGFMDHGRLFITGRLKDLIIIQGRNIYPQDIEALVESAGPDIRTGRVVAFAVPGDLGETLCIVAEYRGRKESSDPLFGRINRDISQAFGIKPEAIILIPPKSLLLTTSGKVRRRDTQKAYLDGRLDIIAGYRRTDDGTLADQTFSGAALVTRLVDTVARKLGLPREQIDVDAPLGKYGLSSMDAMEIAAELEAWTGCAFPPTLIYAHPTITAIVERIGRKTPCRRTPGARRVPPSGMRQPIAIIGIGCQFPGAPDTDAFWRMLAGDESSVGAPPTDRPGFGPAPAADISQAYRRGGFIHGIAQFDAAFFGICAMEAQWMDPQQRRFLEVAWSAIENAGYAPSQLSGSRTGVFAGVSAQDYARMALAGPTAAETYASTGLSAAMLSNRLSYLFNLHGPSETLDTACSSSLVAVHRAVQSIRSGECDLALAGGVNALLSVQTFAALGKTGFLSEDGICRPFDAAANGYVRAEGVGVVLLKPLHLALKDQDHIYALIKGSAVHHGGRSASLTAPSENRQARLLAEAYADAGLSPRTVTYIETHGTGTRLGDPIEINALKKAFAQSAEKAHKTNKAHCALGSVKSNMGHAEAAAGIAGLIKTALALENRSIPGTAHFRRLNPLIEIKHSPFFIARKHKAWQRLKAADGQPIARRAGVSSFGFGGAYAHVVLEEAGHATMPRQKRSADQLVLLSAKTPQALLRQIQALLTYLSAANPRACRHRHQLADIARTLLTGREHFQARAAFIAASKPELKDLLARALENPGDVPGVVFVSENAKRRKRVTLLEPAALSWLKGAAIDHRILDTGHTGRKVPLPTYPFEPTAYWLDTVEPAAAASTGASETYAPEPITYRQVVAWLSAQAAKALGVPAIDPERTFDELGLDSLALIHIHEQLKKRFNTQLPISIIRDYPDIQSLAKLLAGETTCVKTDLWREVATQKAQFLPALENLLETAEAPAHEGLGEHILVTGATGFLGIFLLHELLAQTNAQIYCLVRAANPAAAERRLRAVKTQFALTEALPEHRVHMICGDLCREHFGLPAHRYEEMAQRIDTVLHCGAVVDWMKPYAALKNTNVVGTLSAIRFSIHRKVKRMHYISSLAVLPLIEGNYRWLESDRPDPEALTNGYAQSKWVAERLCLEARDAGLPISIYRFDYVAASTRTGAMKESDFIVRLIRGCIEIGCIPGDEVNFDIHAVDFLSRAIVAIARSAQPRTYHLINRKPFLISDFTRVIRRFGYALEPVPFDHWKALVRANPSCALFPLYPFLDLYDAGKLHHYHQSTIDNTNALTALYAADRSMILNAPPAAEVMQRVIAYFQVQQVLPSPKHQGILKRQTQYWQRQLAEMPARLPLPLRQTGASTPPAPHQTFTLDTGLGSKLLQLACVENVTVAEIMLAAFQLLLCRYCRVKDIAVAVAVAAPRRDGGLTYAKVPILRTILTPGDSLRTALQQVKQIASEALAHLDLPSDEIAAMARAGSDEPDRAGYDALFAFRQGDGEAAPRQRLNLFPLDWEEIGRFEGSINLFVEQTHHTLSGRVQFRSHLLAADGAAGFIGYFQTLLRSLVDAPDADCFQIPIMEASERHKILHHWNETGRDFPSDQSVQALFTRQARLRPEAAAVTMDGHTMTYATLDRQSDRLARCLIDRGLKRGEVIGLCLEKSPALLVGILGILKAGGAYVALEPSYPQQRLKYMLEDTQARMVLTESATAGLVADAMVPTIRLDEDWPTLETPAQERQPTTLPARGDELPDAEDIAYIIYTSGSTGRPKGVKVLHTGLVNLLYAMDEHVQIQPHEKVLSCSSLSYDASVPELFLPLIKGATLVLVPMSVAKDGFQLKAILDRHDIAFMNAAVPTWRMLAYAGWQGSPAIRLINGGEALPQAMAQTLIRWSKAAFNGYGPAEATVCATIKKLEAEKPVTIGRPLANTQVYILDEHLNPMPVGAIGELYLGGRGIAQGYHRRAELTAARFIPNPFDPALSARLYKTGDLGYFLPDGDIVFVGRSDRQIKIRGHRIELGEIERVIEQHCQIEACLVLAQEGPAGDKRIVAYIIPAAVDQQLDLAKIKEELKRALPSFMLPTQFVAMAQWPMTPGGKIDRSALPDPGHDHLAEKDTAPATPLEIEIAALWRKILKLARVGIHASFLDLGGDSISAMQLLIALNKRFGIHLTVQNLYDHLTVAQLAEVVTDLQIKGVAPAAAPVIDFAKEIEFDLPAQSLRLLQKRPVPAQMDQVLMTGATGFLGAVILQKLLETTDKTAYCLVRAGNETHAANRIQSNLNRFRRWKEAYRERIKPVLGDLRQARLGLDSATYADMAKRLDAIYHCASAVNFAYPYQELKKSNVAGTREILRLAVHLKIKPVFYISTVGVFEQYGALDGRRITEDQELPDPNGLFFGYSQSKWVAETIVAAARHKGLPVSIFRPSTILGDSASGVSNIEDLVNIMLKVFARVGAAPDLDFSVNGLPVDFVADAIVRISLAPQALGRNFHIVNPSPVPVAHLIDCFRAYGYDLPVVPPEAWLALLSDTTRTNGDLSPYLPVIKKEIAAMHGHRLPDFCYANTMDLLKNYETTAPRIDAGLFHSYLAYLERIGFIQRPHGSQLNGLRMLG